MRRVLAVILLLVLPGCREERTQSVDPLPLTGAAVGQPGPKAQVHLKGLEGAPLFFAQVRDAVAYSRHPDRSHPVLAIWVSDMGAAGATWEKPGAMNWIHAGAAHYVVGSSRRGGSGEPELVPFAQEAAARDFAAAQGGVVMDLVTIPDSAVDGE
ncbi:nitrous oxide reductase accessory protein NosL [uncultured Paracoccus sp.]|uniref:nitrous oxide reductase accessory protein NosL n=1 Tax=uncultured Paracoccus sp. TaxID=189685 RepID=UPI002626EE6C|nr:nitrous oxide reductase accessory protein NosL [uncultured Paracoccus sp.]